MLSPLALWMPGWWRASRGNADGHFDDVDLAPLKPTSWPINTACSLIADWEMAASASKLRGIAGAALDVVLATAY